MAIGGSIHVLPLCCFLKENHDAFVFAVCTPEINSVSCLNAIRFAHVLYIVMRTVFLHVCTFIIRSFVHGGSIVAGRETFDISAILHFCVSNKKHFDVLLVLAVRRADHSLWVGRAPAELGAGTGFGGDPTFRTPLTAPGHRQNRGKLCSSHIKGTSLPQAQERGIQNRSQDWLNLNVTTMTPKSC